METMHRFPRPITLLLYRKRVEGRPCHRHFGVLSSGNVCPRSLSHGQALFLSPCPKRNAVVPYSNPSRPGRIKLEVGQCFTLRVRCYRLNWRQVKIADSYHRTCYLPIRCSRVNGQDDHVSACTFMPSLVLFLLLKARSRHSADQHHARHLFAMLMRLSIKGNSLPWYSQAKVYQSMFSHLYITA